MRSGKYQAPPAVLSWVVTVAIIYLFGTIAWALYKSLYNGMGGFL